MLTEIALRELAALAPAAPLRQALVELLGALVEAQVEAAGVAGADAGAGTTIYRAHEVETALEALFDVSALAEGVTEAARTAAAAALARLAAARGAHT
jgi:hypothetical protein